VTIKKEEKEARDRNDLDRYRLPGERLTGKVLPRCYIKEDVLGLTELRTMESCWWVRDGERARKGVHRLASLFSRL